MSASNCGVSWLTLRPSWLNFAHQIPGAINVPACKPSSTVAASSTSPRSFHTRTVSPSSIERAAASIGWMCTHGACSRRRNLSTLTKELLRKECAGGEIQASATAIPGRRQASPAPCTRAAGRSRRPACARCRIRICRSAWGNCRRQTAARDQAVRGGRSPARAAHPTSRRRRSGWVWPSTKARRISSSVCVKQASS